MDLCSDFSEGQDSNFSWNSLSGQNQTEKRWAIRFSQSKRASVLFAFWRQPNEQQWANNSAGIFFFQKFLNNIQKKTIKTIDNQQIILTFDLHMKSFVRDGVVFEKTDVNQENYDFSFVLGINVPESADPLLLKIPLRTKLNFTSHSLLKKVRKPISLKVIIYPKLSPQKINLQVVLYHDQCIFYVI